MPHSLSPPPALRATARGLQKPSDKAAARLANTSVPLLALPTELGRQIVSWLGARDVLAPAHASQTLRHWCVADKQFQTWLAWRKLVSAHEISMNIDDVPQGEQDDAYARLNAWLGAMRVFLQEQLPAEDFDAEPASDEERAQLAAREVAFLHRAKNIALAALSDDLARGNTDDDFFDWLDFGWLDPPTPTWQQAAGHLFVQHALFRYLADHSPRFRAVRPLAEVIQGGREISDERLPGNGFEVMDFGFSNSAAFLTTVFAATRIEMTQEALEYDASFEYEKYPAAEAVGELWKVLAGEDPLNDEPIDDEESHREDLKQAQELFPRLNEETAFKGLTEWCSSFLAALARHPWAAAVVKSHMDAEELLPRILELPRAYHIYTGVWCG